jgi:hypothetical protein
MGIEEKKRRLKELENRVPGALAFKRPGFDE